MQNDSTVFVGLDVHKESIVAACAVDFGEVEDLGEVGVREYDWERLWSPANTAVGRTK